jgi:hypothetical protein
MVNANMSYGEKTSRNARKKIFEKINCQKSALNHEACWGRYTGSSYKKMNKCMNFYKIIQTRCNHSTGLLPTSKFCQQYHYTGT